MKWNTSWLDAYGVYRRITRDEHEGAEQGSERGCKNSLGDGDLSHSIPKKVDAVWSAPSNNGCALSISCDDEYESPSGTLNAEFNVAVRLNVS